VKGVCNSNFKVHYVHGVFHFSLSAFLLLYVCKSITLVQSVLIQFFIGEDILTTLNSGCCWVVWTATARITGNTFVHADSNKTAFGC
jgi:hypothetical protein